MSLVHRTSTTVAILSTNTPAPGTPVDAGQRLSPALKQMAGRELQQSNLCAGPQVNATVTLEGYDDAEAVEAALEEVMSGAVSLPVDDSTSASDTICEAEAKLEMMATPLPTEALDENGTGPSTEGNKQPSKTASIVIGARSVTSPSTSSVGTCSRTSRRKASRLPLFGR